MFALRVTLMKLNLITFQETSVKPLEVKKMSQQRKKRIVITFLNSPLCLTPFVYVRH